uniref:Uncharacterized protein n=1 Tax=Kalanchoe fedtschenkoi TaxID=63787 RepID=A0A7N0RJH8_KALFE
MAAARFNRGNLIIKDENLGVNLQKKDGVNGKGKSILTGNKKGVGLGSRKALNDITNKFTLRQEAALKRNNAAKEGFNVKDETFLHDHKKCEEAHRKLGLPCFFETVLPGIGSSFSHVSTRSIWLWFSVPPCLCYTYVTGQVVFVPEMQI